MVMTHCEDIQIRFSDYDSFGHINNNAYMAYLDIGKFAFYRSLFGCQPTADQIGAVIVNINVDFMAPSVVGEPLQVQTAVASLGNKSFSLYQRIVCKTSGHIKAQATTVIAGFDMATGVSAPLNDRLAVALRELYEVNAGK